ncbi:hypothetical protein Bbelb_376430 [Branchiostoma belcheri]|nr:hypothetical protein Bbelb_376430 [Branchiostoma belcheri]
MSWLGVTFTWPHLAVPGTVVFAHERQVQLPGETKLYLCQGQVCLHMKGKFTCQVRQNCSVPGEISLYLYQVRQVRTAEPDNSLTCWRGWPSGQTHQPKIGQGGGEAHTNTALTYTHQPKIGQGGGEAHTNTALTYTHQPKIGQGGGKAHTNTALTYTHQPKIGWHWGEANTQLSTTLTHSSQR